MAVSVANFQARFPEFASTDTGLITLVLAEASAQIETSVWSTRRDEGIKYLTAHLLAISPMGEPARLGADKMETIYGKHFERLMKQVTFGLRNA